jgi:hypothetical protein
LASMEALVALTLPNTRNAHRACTCIGHIHPGASSVNRLGHITHRSLFDVWWDSKSRASRIYKRIQVHQHTKAYNAVSGYSWTPGPYVVNIWPIPATKGLTCIHVLPWPPCLTHSGQEIRAGAHQSPILVTPKISSATCTFRRAAKFMGFRMGVCLRMGT